MDIILIYVTHKDKNNAQKVTDHLFNLRLIASVSWFPVESQYFRKNNIEQSQEYVTIYKTKPQNREKVKQEIKKIHSYAVPSIIKVTGEVNHAYGNRVVENVA